MKLDVCQMYFGHKTIYFLKATQKLIKSIYKKRNFKHIYFNDYAAINVCKYNKLIITL